MISSLYRWHWKQIFFDIWLFNIKYKKISFYWRYKEKLLSWETWHRNKITHICFQCLKDMTKHLLDCYRKYQSYRSTFFIRSAVKVYSKRRYFYHCTFAIVSTFFFALITCSQRFSGSWRKYTKIVVTQFSTTPRVLIKSNRSNGNSCWIYRRALC